MVKYRQNITNMNLNNLPAPFLERLAELPAPHRELVEQGLSQPRVTSFRINTLQGSIEDVRQHLREANYTITQLSWWSSAFYLPDPSVHQIFHPDYVEGKLYVQGLSSMLPPLILDPQPGERILDLTAAPGSKTTQIAALMKNEGSILANDLSPVRLFKLQANLKQQGVTIAQVKRGAGELLWRKFPEQFDRTLVDVPCSMEGRFNNDDPKTYEDWSVKKVKELSLRQRLLLRSAISATKPGGVIIYSTCTLAPEENEAVVQWVLEKEHGKVVLEQVELPHLGEQTAEVITPGVTSWLGTQFSEELVKTLRIYPSPTMEGFYVAKLRKLESTLTPESWGRADTFRHRGHRNSKHHQRRRR
jgi:tRNA (cytosine49-C5)-methyltransferase